MKKLPTKYIATLPRVSAIVEYFYPFTWNARERFEDWLLWNDIGVDEYMKEASTWGTFVHSKLEDYMKWKDYRWKKYRWFIEAWKSFIVDYNVSPIAMEEYIRTNDFQGTIDLIWEIDGEKWILDWKTFGLAKHKFWLPIPSYKKPYDKLKKARLQLSLYSLATWIKNIWIVELLDWEYHFHKLELIDEKELLRLIKEYSYHYIDEI